MFDAIITFFYSSVIWLAYMIPTRNMGFAIMVLAVLIYIILHFTVRKTHLFHRHMHHILHMHIEQLPKKTMHTLHQVYESFTYLPWRGLGSSFIYALVFFFFFFIVSTLLDMSPSDLSHLWLPLSFHPQYIHYEFLGVNVTSHMYSSWYLIGFSLFVFISMFLHTASKWRHNKSQDIKYIIELGLIIFIAKIFMIILRNFSFGVLIFWWTYVMIALIVDIVMHPKMLQKVFHYLENLNQRTADEKEHALWTSQNFFHRFFIQKFAKKQNMNVQKATKDFHVRHHMLNHSHIFEAIRHQLVSYPYLIIVILMTIYFFCR